MAAKDLTPKDLTPEKSLVDFKRAYANKRKLIEREREDFLYALGQQWPKEVAEDLAGKKIKPVTDNRIQPNIFLLTGLERQNRSDFKAFPEGEEDTLKAEIATALFKNSVKISDFGYKVSDQFKDGVTCGESHLELYLDYTYNLLNGKPVWRKADGCLVFPEPGFREYDYSDARYVYKLTPDLSKDDLITLYPDKKADIEAATNGKLNMGLMGSDSHVQPKDYPSTQNPTSGDVGEAAEDRFDLLERYYKKFVEKTFIGDNKTGQIKEAESKDTADSFVSDYEAKAAADQAQASAQIQSPTIGAIPGQAPQGGGASPRPPMREPGRFKIFTRHVPEMWVYAHVPGMKNPLADERAWFYPAWKGYPLVPFFARFSTAPLEGDDRHLLVQGLVHGVKDAQDKHNKAETLMLLHLNTSANSGWLSEEDAWVDETAVKEFGASPGINLKYKKGSPKPERIQPVPLSAAHAQLAVESAEGIKAQLGINADLLAVQQGGTDSGRAIALRQRQGLLMVQELFDNLSRTKQIAGKFLLSQLGEIYDTETAVKVLGEDFLVKNFPPLMQGVIGPDGGPAIDPATGQPQEEPLKDALGQPMQYDKDLAEVAIAEVLQGDLGTYDVAVGETVASETMKMANAAEIKEIAQSMPGLIPPDILIEESNLPQATKNRLLSLIKNAQPALPPTPPGNPAGAAGPMAGAGGLNATPQS